MKSISGVGLRWGLGLGLEAGEGEVGSRNSGACLNAMVLGLCYCDVAAASFPLRSSSLVLT